MKIKTSELTGAALDWAVAVAEGLDCRVRGDKVCVSRRTPCPDRLPGCAVAHYKGEVYSPSTDWAQGGPIIDENLLVVSPDPVRNWVCRSYMDARTYYGPTPLVAAMRCYVVSKLGEEIEIPEDLL